MLLMESREGRRLRGREETPALRSRGVAGGLVQVA